MKRKIGYKVIILLSIFITFTFSLVRAVDVKEEYEKEYKENIYSMAKIMRCIPKTGDLNLDYLYEIALFNQGEIEFCEAYAQVSSNTEIKSIAERCIEREKAAEENIKAIAERLKDNVKKDEDNEKKYLKKYNEILNNTLCKFQKVELTQDIDKNFLKFIVIHHNGVIELTEEYLKVSNNDEVKQLADKINREMKNDVSLINRYI